MFRSRRSGWAAVVVPVTAGTVFALSAVTADARENSRTAAAASTYNIGFFPSLTGFLGPFDTEVLKGVKLEIAKVNRAGGIAGKYKIKLNVEDSASDPAKSRIAAQDLVGKGARFLIGPCQGGIAIPGALYAQSKRIPVVTSCAGDSSFPKKVGSYAFLGNAGALAQGSALAQFAAKRGWKRAYVVGSSGNDYVSAITSGFRYAYPKNGGSVVGSDSVELFKQSYSASVDKIRSSGRKYDVIFTPLFVPDVVTFITELRSAGITAPVLVDDGGDTPLLFAQGNPGKVFVATFGFPRPKSRLAAFNRRYAKAYGKRPVTTQPGLGADLVDLIAAAVRNAKSTDPTKVRNAFAALRNVKATTSTISYKHVRYGQGLQRHPFVIETVAGKAFKYVTTINPKYVQKP